MHPQTTLPASLARLSSRTGERPPSRRPSAEPAGGATEGQAGAVASNSSHALNNRQRFCNLGFKQPNPPTAATNQKLEQIFMSPKYSLTLEPQTCPFPIQGGWQLNSYHNHQGYSSA